MSGRTITVEGVGEQPARQIAIEAKNLIGPFAVHPWISARPSAAASFEGGAWTATHVASGHNIGKLRSRDVAAKLARKLIPLTNADEADPAKAFTDGRAAMDVVIVERRRASGRC